MKYIDLTGQVFGRLTALYRTEDHVYKSGRREAVFHCRCSCGKELDVFKNALTNGNTKSCGCLGRDEAKKRMTKRDDISRSLRIVYIHMYSRCYDEKDKRYDRYGGRGITMCDEWLGPDGQENFIKWGRKNGYAKGLTIDRKDNDGNYCPQNCRWVTMKEQCNNRSTNKFLTVDGETKTIAQWIEYLELKSNRLYYHEGQDRIDFVRRRLKQLNK